jgi:hypothetical protein
VVILLFDWFGRPGRFFPFFSSLRGIYGSSGSGSELIAATFFVLSPPVALGKWWCDACAQRAFREWRGNEGDLSHVRAAARLNINTLVTTIV